MSTKITTPLGPKTAEFFEKLDDGNSQTGTVVATGEFADVGGKKLPVFEIRPSAANFARFKHDALAAYADYRKSYGKNAGEYAFKSFFDTLEQTSEQPGAKSEDVYRLFLDEATAKSYQDNPTPGLSIVIEGAHPANPNLKVVRISFDESLIENDEAFADKVASLLGQSRDANGTSADPVKTADAARMANELFPLDQTSLSIVKGTFNELLFSAEATIHYRGVVAGNDIAAYNVKGEKIPLKVDSKNKGVTDLTLTLNNKQAVFFYRASDKTPLFKLDPKITTSDDNSPQISYVMTGKEMPTLEILQLSAEIEKVDFSISGDFAIVKGTYIEAKKSGKARIKYDGTLIPGSDLFAINERGEEVTLTLTKVDGKDTLEFIFTADVPVYFYNKTTSEVLGQATVSATNPTIILKPQPLPTLGSIKSNIIPELASLDIPVAIQFKEVSIVDGKFGEKKVILPFKGDLEKNKIIATEGAMTLPITINGNQIEISFTPKNIRSGSISITEQIDGLTSSLAGITVKASGTDYVIEVIDTESVRIKKEAYKQFRKMFKELLAKEFDDVKSPTDLDKYIKMLKGDLTVYSNSQGHLFDLEEDGKGLSISKDDRKELQKNLQFKIKELVCVKPSQEALIKKKIQHAFQKLLERANEILWPKAAENGYARTNFSGIKLVEITEVSEDEAGQISADADE